MLRALPRTPVIIKYGALCKNSYRVVAVNPFMPGMPGVNKNVTHTKTNQQLSAAGLFKYV